MNVFLGNEFLQHSRADNIYFRSNWEAVNFYTEVIALSKLCLQTTQVIDTVKIQVHQVHQDSA